MDPIPAVSRRLAAALTLTCLPAVAGAQVMGTDARFERVATRVEALMREQGIPGVALGVSHAGERSVRGFGITSAENPLPVTETTLFQAGSITKTFTATAAMRLVEAGRLRLDEPVARVLPGFRVRDEEATRQATLRTLLTHTGGWEGDLFEDPGDGDDALARLVERMAALEQIAPLDAFWSYNNAGFYAAGRLIEVVTGMPYEAALRDLVIAPLGLRRTFLFPAEVMTYRFAVGHAGPPERPIVLRPWTLPRALGPAGGVAASADDLLRYAEFHLGDGTAPDGSRVLSPATMRTLRETQLAKQGSDEEMALGWQVSRLGPHRELWHDGAAIGQMSLVLVVPDARLAVVVLTNSVRGERFNQEVRRAVAREYLGVEIPGLTPAATPPAPLTEYAGRYTRPFMDVVVSVDGERLMIQRIQKQGFPRASAPLPPPFPPTPYGLYARDRAVGVVPAAGDRVEFLRGADGEVGWVRIGGRIARRAQDVAGAGS